MLSIFYSFLIISSILLILYIINLYYAKVNKIKNKQLYKNYIGSILILFGILKLINLNKFVDIFRKYDIIGKHIPLYAFSYPFLEIILGILYFYDIEISKVKFVNMTLMLISIISVLISLVNGQKLRCGCLGSFFHIPLSYVTLSENIVMIMLNKLV